MVGLDATPSSKNVASSSEKVDVIDVSTSLLLNGDLQKMTVVGLDDDDQPDFPQQGVVAFKHETVERIPNMLTGAKGKVWLQTNCACAGRARAVDLSFGHPRHEPLSLNNKSTSGAVRMTLDDSTDLQALYNMNLRASLIGQHIFEAENLAPAATNTILMAIAPDAVAASQIAVAPNIAQYSALAVELLDSEYGEKLRKGEILDLATNSLSAVTFQLMDEQGGSRLVSFHQWPGTLSLSPDRSSFVFAVPLQRASAVPGQVDPPGLQFEIPVSGARDIAHVAQKLCNAAEPRQAREKLIVAALQQNARFAAVLNQSVNTAYAMELGLMMETKPGNIPADLHNLIAACSRPIAARVSQLLPTKTSVITVPVAECNGIQFDMADLQVPPIENEHLTPEESLDNRQLSELLVQSLRCSPVLDSPVDDEEVLSKFVDGCNNQRNNFLSLMQRELAEPGASPLSVWSGEVSDGATCEWDPLFRCVSLPLFLAALNTVALTSHYRSDQSFFENSGTVEAVMAEKMATELTDSASFNSGDCEDLAKISCRLQARCAATVESGNSPTPVLVAKPLPDVRSAGTELSWNRLESVRDALAWISRCVVKLRPTLAMVSAPSVAHVDTTKEQPPALHAHGSAMLAHHEYDMFAQSRPEKGLSQFSRGDGVSNAARTPDGLPLQYRIEDCAAAIIGMRAAASSPAAFMIEGTGPVVNYATMALSHVRELVIEEHRMLVRSERAMPPVKSYREKASSAAHAIATRISGSESHPQQPLSAYGSMSGDAAAADESPILAVCMSNMQPFTFATAATTAAQDSASASSSGFLEPQLVSTFYDTAISSTPCITRCVPSLAAADWRSPESQRKLGVKDSDVVSAGDVEYYGHAVYSCESVSASGAPVVTKGIPAALLTVINHRALSSSRPKLEAHNTATLVMCPVGSRSPVAQVALRQLLLRQNTCVPAQSVPYRLELSADWRALLEATPVERRSKNTHFLKFFSLAAAKASTGKRIPMLLQREMDLMNAAVPGAAAIVSHHLLQPSPAMYSGGKEGALIIAIQVSYEFYNSSQARKTVLEEIQKVANATRPPVDAEHPFILMLSSHNQAHAHDHTARADARPRPPVLVPLHAGVPTFLAQQPHGHVAGHEHAWMPDAPTALSHGFTGTQEQVAAAASSHVVPQPDNTAQPEPELATASMPVRMNLGATINIGNREKKTTRPLIALVRLFESGELSASYRLQELAEVAGVTPDAAVHCVRSAVLRQCVGADKSYTHDVFELLGDPVDPIVVLSDSSCTVLRRYRDGSAPAGCTFVCDA
jgi:hypothetical protein